MRFDDAIKNPPCGRFHLACVEIRNLRFRTMTNSAILHRDLAYVLVAAVLGGLAARKLRQPTILGYVAAGIIVGPFTPGPSVSDVHALEVVAEVGVILLMYSIGIEFSPRDLAEVKWVAIGGGLIGIVLAVGLGFLTGHLLGWSMAQGLAVGAIVSVASTMVLSRFLMDRGELRSEHGRVMIGITLVEDLAVVVLTVVLPTLNGFNGHALAEVGLSFGKAFAIISPVALIAAKVVPPLMQRVARTGSQELFVLVAVSLGFATAALTRAMGLSLALGAFLAGVIISGSEFAHETLLKLLPLRDVFVAIFFVSIGALINPRVLSSDLFLLIVLVALILVGKFLIWFAVVSLFRYPLATALLVSVGLTQIGEFSYVLVQVARGAELVTDRIYRTLLMASLLSILLNAFLVRMVPRYVRTNSAPLAR